MPKRKAEAFQEPEAVAVQDAPREPVPARRDSQRPKGVRMPPPELVQVGVIQPAPYNPRKISAKEMEALKGSIREHGLVEPLVVQRRSEQFGDFVLIGGHQRLKAVREIAIEDNVELATVYCCVVDVDDRTAKRLNISLNNVGGEFDAQLLGELLEDINAASPIAADEVLGMGFDDDEFRDLLHLGDPPNPDDHEPKTFGKSVTVSLEFKDTATRDAVKEKLQERAKKQRQTTGEVVLGLLNRRGK